jgi:hypothetical protein
MVFPSWIFIEVVSEVVLFNYPLDEFHDMLGGDVEHMYDTASKLSFLLQH